MKNKVYIFTGDFNIKRDTCVFATITDALDYVNRAVRIYWQTKNMNFDIHQIPLGFEILITDNNNELVATYYIFEREVI